MLSDPKKLKTRRGHGFLVSWKDKLRVGSEAEALALAKRLLEDDRNVEEFRRALGRPSAPEAELEEWLVTGLFGGGLAAIRTSPRVPLMDPPEVTDLSTLVRRNEKNVVGPATTWFEVAVLDEHGRPLPDVGLTIEVGGTREALRTDDRGTARHSDAELSFARVRFSESKGLAATLEERWSTPDEGPWMDTASLGQHTALGYADPLPMLALESATTHTVVFQPRVSRARLAGLLFDTNKAFLLPSALQHITSLRALYDEHPESSLLIVGHTDTTGDPSFNDPLSVERARAVAAFLTDDVEAWLRYYEPQTSWEMRWGEGEDAHMRSAVFLARAEQPGEDSVRHFQHTRGLVVDGVAGSQTRRALIEEYMSADGTTLPPGVVPVIHGCGENFPLREEDMAGFEESAPVDGVGGRRVELYFFDAPLPLLPPPPGLNSGPDAREYPTWRARARHCRDFVATHSNAVAVHVTNERSGEPLSGARVLLMRQAGLDGVAVTEPLGGETDNYGVMVFQNVVAGTYEVNVAHTSFVGHAVAHEVGPADPPKVVSAPLRTAVGSLSLEVKNLHTLAPVVGADVRLEGPQTALVLTDASGAAVFESLAEGEYALQATAVGFDLLSTSVEVHADEEAALEVLLTSEEATTGRLAVLVVGPDGQSVPGAHLRLNATSLQEATTDTAGAAEFGTVPIGTLMLETSAPWFAFKAIEVSVEAGQTTTVTINLSELRITLEGVVFYNRTWNYNDETKPFGPLEEVLPGAKVQLRIKPAGAGALTIHDTSHLDEHGAFSFDKVPRCDAVEVRVFLEHAGGKVTAFVGDTTVVNKPDFALHPNLPAWHQFALSTAQLKRMDGSAATVHLGKLELTEPRFVDMCDAYKSVWFGHAAIKRLTGDDLPYCEIRYPAALNSSHLAGKIHLEKDDLKNRDVILHEYGHFIVGKKLPSLPKMGYAYDDGSGTSATGHSRSSKEHYESSWAEGLATFLSCAMSDDPHYHNGYGVPVNYHLDTDNTQIGPHAEGSIQEALWEAYKGQGLPFKSMWAALTNTAKHTVSTVVLYHKNWAALGIVGLPKLTAALRKFNIEYVYEYPDGNARFKAVAAPKGFSASAKTFRTVDELYAAFGKPTGGTKVEYLEEFYNRNKKLNPSALGSGSTHAAPKVIVGNSYIVPRRVKL